MNNISELVFFSFKEELEKMKQKKKAEEEVKPRRRVKIEEVEDDDEEEERPSRKAAGEGGRFDVGRGRLIEGGED